MTARAVEFAESVTVAHVNSFVLMPAAVSGTAGCAASA
jgi:hypothetical protein